MHFALTEKIAERLLPIRPNSPPFAVLFKGTETSCPHNKSRQNKKGDGVSVMAQIWLTYEEIGEFFSCSSATARDLAINHSWTRRRSRDGQTRVKLPQDLMTQFISRAAAALQAFQYKSSALVLNLEPDRGYTATLEMPPVARHIADAMEHAVSVPAEPVSQ
jgi:hypothetical protein